MSSDAERLTAYVHGVWRRSRSGRWPTIRQAAKSLRWTQPRVEMAIDDAEHLDTQSYYCEPPEPRWAHEICSTADECYRAEVAQGGRP